jgi:hypothetical protein
MAVTDGHPYPLMTRTMIGAAARLAAAESATCPLDEAEGDGKGAESRQSALICAQRCTPRESNIRLPNCGSRRRTAFPQARQFGFWDGKPRKAAIQADQ